MSSADRYGIVLLKEDGSIKSFEEKKPNSSGLINGGVYTLQTESFLKENLPDRFSFEKDYLEKFYSVRRMFGFRQDKYFIDIGLPEDYSRAQKEFEQNR
jgi:D-glycero-alpha-D-manno-heptose 1-phosphate guanylyltransferase